jgi:CRISPR system Cascade subunit CasA
MNVIVIGWGESMPSLDLLRQPWIPVRYARHISGPPSVGLADLFARAHEIADITVPVPPAMSALWRVLYLITARIAGLDDVEAVDGIAGWKRARNRAFAARRFDGDAIRGYFSRYDGRFDLFDPARPWLQDPRLAAECPKSTGINKLIVGRATGNNLVWLSHATDLAPQPVPTDEAAWYLLAWLYYGPSGKITARIVRGMTESNMTAGPLRSRISFHPLGPTLYQSLIAGLVYPGRYDARTDGLALAGSDDLAPWEADGLPDPLGLPPAPHGLSGVLTGQFRHALLLTPSRDGSQVTDARITWAWRLTTPPAEDPYLIYDTAKNRPGTYARYARLERAVWRDLDALLLEDTGESKRPAVFTDLAGAPREILKVLRVRAIGFDQDGQTIDRQWFTATTPPVLAMADLDESSYGYDVKVAREAAERVGQNLQRALRQAWAAVSTGDGPWEPRGMTRYWAGAETVFWQMVDSRDFSFPDNRFINEAVAAFDAVTSQHEMRGPRVIRAVEKARRRIYASWVRTGPDAGEAESA